jgi:transcriptional regulator with XRE-family HTH domain
MNIRQIFIRNLRRVRRGAGFSQMKLAEKCDTSTNYLGCIESGLKFPSIHMIEKLAKALNVQPYQLFLPEQNSVAKTPYPKPVLPESLKENLIHWLEIIIQRIRKY